jgi:mxaD protein
MKKISLFISLALVFFASVATAHGPVRGKMTATVSIDAPADKVWDVISNYDDMSWHPAITNVEADKGNTKGSVRVLTLKGGGTITEELKKHDDAKMSYKYKITELSTVKTIQHAGQDEDVPVLPVENYQATLTVKDKGGKAVVTWVATYYRGYVNNNPPEELNEEAADAAVTTVLTDGLTSLLQKFEANGDSSAVKITMKR